MKRQLRVLCTTGLRRRRPGANFNAVVLLAAVVLLFSLAAGVLLLSHDQAFAQGNLPVSGPSNGDWIAYSTAQADNQRRGSNGVSGSDVFMIRASGQPKLVSGRGKGAIWNVCPAFSPSGTMLAFGRKAPRGEAIIVLGVTRSGTIGPPKVIFKVRGPWARCPKWSSDSSRLAYVDATGTIIVRGLDGSRPEWANGDPTINEFSQNKSGLLSPAGDLVASLSNGTIVVSRPNDSGKRVIKDSPPSYAIAGWSPDGRKLLVVRDVGGGFMIRAVSAEAPFASTTIAAYVRVNNERSWPGYGDVSWQPTPQG
jgi:Tol biopolymer transport system component